MIVHENGNSTDPIVILLHPMEVTGTEMYEVFRSCSTEHVLYIYPDEGGHGEDQSDYTNADQEEKILADYLAEHGYTHIHLLYSASMGSAVALRLIEDGRFSFDHIHMDGTPLVNKAPFTEKMMEGMFLRARRACLKDPGRRADNNLHRIYGKKWGDLMTENFMKFSEATIRNICKACCTDNCRRISPKLQKKIVFEWGDKDPDLKLSRKNREKYFPESKVIVRKGYGHCGYMAAESERYVRELMEETRK